MRILALLYLIVTALLALAPQMMGPSPPDGPVALATREGTTVQQADSDDGDDALAASSADADEDDDDDVDLRRPAPLASPPKDRLRHERRADLRPADAQRSRLFRPPRLTSV